MLEIFFDTELNYKKIPKNFLKKYWKKSKIIFRKNLNLICHVVYTSWKKVINEFDLQNWVTFWVEDIMLIFFPWLFRESILGSWNVSSLQSFFAKATRCANMKTIYLFKKKNWRAVWTLNSQKIQHLCSRML